MDKDNVFAIIKELLAIIDDTVNSDEISDMINYSAHGVSPRVRDLLKLLSNKSAMTNERINEIIASASASATK